MPVPDEWTTSQPRPSLIDGSQEPENSRHQPDFLNNVMAALVAAISFCEVSAVLAENVGTRPVKTPG